MFKWFNNDKFMLGVYIAMVCLATWNTYITSSASWTFCAACYGMCAGMRLADIYRK
jgi:hypothetical protein